MKILFGIWLAGLLELALPAQGIINFANNATTLVTAGPPAQTGFRWWGPCYFGLLTAPLGTTDPTQFTFSGLYATNLPATGRFRGGMGVMVPGWLPGAPKSFLVAGWSADLGVYWNQNWLSGLFSNTGYFGISSIGSAAAGGSLPPLNLFGGSTGIQSGFTLAPVDVPEPSLGKLVVLAVAIFFRRGWRRPFVARRWV